MIRSYKFRLFTNANQERELAFTLETHRRLYNEILDGRALCWEAARVNWSYFDQTAWFTIQRRINPFFGKLNYRSAALTIKRADDAYMAFVKGKGKRARFKSRDRMMSFAFRYSNGGKVMPDGKLRLHNIGTIRVKWHRQLPAGKIKLARILVENGKWFVTFAIEVANPEPTRLTASVGIDVGLKSFVTTSGGESLGDSKTLENALPELRRRQRELSRCKCGSFRRLEVKRGVARLHAKVRNVRLDMHHKVARSLVNRYGVIAAESLSVVNMLRNRRLARRIADAGWGQFVSVLCGKAESAGCQVILVDPKNTSQECSECGAIVRKSLAVRVHKCACGCVLDRDENAARNILGRAGPEDRNEGNSLHGPKSRQLLLVV